MTTAPADKKFSFNTNVEDKAVDWAFYTFLALVDRIASRAERNSSEVIYDHEIARATGIALHETRRLLARINEAGLIEGYFRIAGDTETMWVSALTLDGIMFRARIEDCYDLAASAFSGGKR